MARRILKTLSNNIGFKLLALFLALILWLVVYNLEDPEKTRNFTVKVTVTNVEELEDMNLCYEIDKNSGTVRVPVNAKRSILDNLGERNFTAVADMKNIAIDTESMTGEVPIEVTSDSGYSSIKIHDSDLKLYVKLEPLMSKQFVISPRAKGTVAKGYTLGELAINSQNVIKVSGPEAIVSQIAGVVAIIDVEGMSQAMNDSVVPTLLTKDEDVIDTTRLKLSSNTVAIRASILNTKEIALNIIPSGSLKNNYFVTKVSSDPSKVTVKGSAAALNAISSIDISSDALKLTNETMDDIVTTVDITGFLPEGVSLLNNEDAIISVSIGIEEYQTHTFNLNTSAITVNGLDARYQLEFLVNAINVKVSGMESVMNILTLADFKASIDASALQEGVSVVKVDLGLKEDDYQADPVTLSVRVSLMEEVTEENTEEPTQMDSQEDSQTEGLEEERGYRDTTGDE